MRGLYRKERADHGRQPARVTFFVIPSRREDNAGPARDLSEGPIITESRCALVPPTDYASEPLAEGDFYPGELLKMVLSVDATFWQNHPHWRKEVEEISQHAKA